MDIENQDDWDPDPHKKDSILQFSNINFSGIEYHLGLDNVIKRNKKLENTAYDSQYVMDYAQQNWIDDDEDEEMKIIHKLNSTSNRQKAIDDGISVLQSIGGFIKRKYVQSKYEAHLKNSENNTVISCSNCFIQISYHCQQHEIYKKQYRAMVTINTKIIENKFVKPLENEKVKNDDILLSVQCKMCQEEIGVYDVKAKIYHFFNVVQGLG